MNYRSLLASVSYCLIVVLSVACQSTPKIADGTDRQLEKLLAGDVFLGTPLAGVEALPDEQPFALTPEMKRFAHYYAPESMNPSFRLRQLTWAIINPTTLGLQYNPGATHTSEQSFTLREANCLSFTMLFIAMAEEVGLKAEFNDVEVPPTWDLQDNHRLIYYRHVNALASLPWQSKVVIDINMEDYNENYNQTTISRADAEALYYNNRGVEAMANNDNTKAFLYLRKAIELNPKSHFIWSNFGVLYRRAEHIELAEAAFRHALSFGKFEAVAGSNLARIYRDTNREAEAAELDRAIVKFRNRNPYLKYKLALDAYSNGDDQKALATINKAIKLHAIDHRFYHLQAKIYARLGDINNAKDSLSQAEAMSVKSEEKDVYRSKLERLATLH